MLKENFYRLVGEYAAQDQIDSLWTEIKKAYGHTNRHYHNLEHLTELFNNLAPLKQSLKDWETLSFSIFYHDIVYNVRRQDNEKKSADLAKKRLEKLNVPIEIVQLCHEQIIATKTHEVSDHPDTNYFTDADLCILGKDWTIYERYYKAIRNEYKIYPNLIYNPARKKVLRHFLEMTRLFKTDYFFEQYETTARTNLERELDLLS